MVQVKLVAPDRCVPISSWGGWLGVALLTALCPSFACHVYEEVLSVAARLILPEKLLTPKLVSQMFDEIGQTYKAGSVQAIYIQGLEL